MKLACRVSLSAVCLLLSVALRAQERPPLRVVSDQTFDEVIVGSQTATAPRLNLLGSNAWGNGGVVMYVDNYNTTGVSGIRLDARELEQALGGALYHVGSTQTRLGAFSAGSTVLTGYDAAGLSLFTSSTSGNGIRFFTADDQPAGERMRIASTGRVGIGTAAPLFQLDVSATSSLTLFPGTPVTMAVLDENAYSTQGVLGAGIGFGGFYNATQIAVWATISGVRENNALDNYAGALTFGARKASSGAESIERMRLTSNGELLIGLNAQLPFVTPAPKLVVAGDAYDAMVVLTHAEPLRYQGRIRVTSGETGRPSLRIGTQYCAVDCDPADSADQRFSDTLTIYQNKLGINETNPDATLVVGGTMSIHHATATLRGLRFGAEGAGFSLNGTNYDEVNTITPVNVGAASTRSVVHFRSAVNGSIRNDLDVVVDGNIAAKYQDVAEWVPSTHDLEPGTVVVLNPLGINEVMASRTPYDTAVAGVVSARPGLILGEAGANKEQIATTGRVKVKVDATLRPIAVGDLLVTGTRPGTAMVSAPIEVAGVKIHRPGTIIGKALEPLASGEGEILVLLSMQ